MEEILILLLQLFFELGLELLIWTGLDLAAWSITRQEKHGTVGCSAMFVFFLIGAGLGALMNWLYPRPLLDYEWLRIANLILAPVLVGGAAWLFAEWRRRRGAKLLPSLHFWFAFCFVLGFDAVRFAYSRREALGLG